LTLSASPFRVAAALALLATVGVGGTATAAAPHASATPTATAAVGSLHITKTAVNARGHPTVESKALFVVAAKTTVRVYRTAIDSQHRLWYLVHVDSRPGWIAGWLTKAAPPKPVSTWHAAIASSFGIGDGLVGNRMACGSQLTTAVMAVAHRTLPCGTLVRIRVGSRLVVARVMDRGPFTPGRTFDLAPAVCRALASCDGAFKIEWQTAP
jgi:rare lipoprotein A (peptidoglycan hydrolase)